MHIKVILAIKARYPAARSAVSFTSGKIFFVGIAYSRMNSDFKFKGSSTGDKLSAESDIISLYGQQQFSNGFILQEIFSASNSKINKKDLRPVGLHSYKTVSGKSILL
ncbi:MAG: autotransporter outer membrane beta-barrel domain-containing protein [Rickettsia endosymbiont of Haemaphysalis japonica]